ncbi:MAG: hypothetical protein OEV30_10395, partial [Ignavibacteria bacterium]|nr:hypothetical protein [Ignavibacteria bacterium]
MLRIQRCRSRRNHKEITNTTRRESIADQRKPRINNDIRAAEVRVIDQHGGQLGVMTPAEGIRIAGERGADLVEIVPKAKPP